MPFYPTSWPPNEPDSWPILVQIMKKSPYPNMTVTSTQRSGNSDYHDFGMAVDFARPMDAAGRAMMRDFAQWFYQYSDYLIELIHTTPFDTDNGFYVKNGVKRSPGFYGAATEAAHDNHVHVSISHRGANELLEVVSRNSTPQTPSGGGGMAEYAPDSLKWLGNQLKGLGGQLSGIVGDRAHTYGYHRARNVLPGGDYSVKLAEDRSGDSSAASAIDMNFPPDKMRLYTQRLIDATNSKDPRVRYIREFYGTTNGANVHGRTHSGENAGWEFASSDDSHLWHIHISFFRKYATSMDAAHAIYDILAGRDTQPGASASMGDDDDMPTGMGPIQLPQTPKGEASYSVFPVNAGGLPWGEAFLTIVGDLFGGRAAVRIATADDRGNIGVIKDKVVLESRKLFNMKLPTATRLVSIVRLPVDDNDPCTASLSMSIEYGRR